MKRMLINATQAEEVRVALVDGQQLYDLDIESSAREQRKANIYKGRITRIEPSLEAAFVDYGSERHGFLPLKEVAREYFPANFNNRGRPNIKDVLREGQEVIVQIDKEERGNKGAALTTFISLAGCYLVLMPNNPRAGGVSRRIEGEERAELKAAMSNLHVPDGMGLIVRTAGVGKSNEELEWDLSVLLALWDAIKRATEERPAPFLVYQESDVITRAIRDYLRKDIGEILIDDQDAFNRACKHIRLVRPDFVERVKLYQDKIPLFSRFQIESQIESAFKREVQLPSGGSIVIDPTEAFTSIDINSAKATKGGDIEETALNTNLEAADEIARQLRLRDIGGLVVIDYIDMTPPKNREKVESRFKESLKKDRARVQIGKISRFGLLEMSRQRLRPSLGESSNELCPRCHGTGSIRGIESVSLSILRLIEEESMKANTDQVHVQVPVEVGTFLLNEKRQSIAELEQRQNVNVVIIPNRHMDTPQYELTRIRTGEASQIVSYTVAQQMVPEQDAPVTLTPPAKKEKSAEPAVHSVEAVKSAPTPTAVPVAKTGFLSKLIKQIFTFKEESQDESTANSSKSTAKSSTTTRKNAKDGSATATESRNARSRSGDKRNERRSNRDDNKPASKERSERTERGERAERGERTRRGKGRSPRNDKDSSRENRTDGNQSKPVRRSDAERRNAEKRPRSAEPVVETQVENTAVEAADVKAAPKTKNTAEQTQSKATTPVDSAQNNTQDNTPQDTAKSEQVVESIAAQTENVATNSPKADVTEAVQPKVETKVAEAKPVEAKPAPKAAPSFSMKASIVMNNTGDSILPVHETLSPVAKESPVEKTADIAPVAAEPSSSVSSNVSTVAQEPVNTAAEPADTSSATTVSVEAATDVKPEAVEQQPQATDVVESVQKAAKQTTFAHSGPTKASAEHIADTQAEPLQIEGTAAPSVEVASRAKAQQSFSPAAKASVAAEQNAVPKETVITETVETSAPTAEAESVVITNDVTETPVPAPIESSDDNAVEAETTGSKNI